MTKLTGAALDRAVAHAMGVKSVHNCEKWGEHMNRIEEDDDTQDYKKPWVGLTDEEVSKIIDDEIGFNSCWGPEEQFARAIEAKLKEKNT